MPRRILHQRAAILLTAAVLLALPLQAVASPPHHKHEAREEIMALEQQWRQAQLTADVATMDKLLSDDFLGINVTGEVVTKAQQLDRMRSRKSTVTTLDISDIKVKVVGQIAIVTSLAKIEGTGSGSGTSSMLNGSFRSTRIYQQQLPSGVWKITNFEVTRIRPGGPAPEPPPPPPPAHDPPTKK